MFFVELELDGVLCVKRCPALKDMYGLADSAAVRRYFEELGYRVGAIHSIR